MHVLHQVHGPQQIGLTRAGRAPALIHPADRARFTTQDDCAAGEANGICGVADTDPENRGEGVIGRSSAP